MPLSVAKQILIAVSVVVLIVIIGVGFLVGWAFYMASDEGFKREVDTKSAEGREFGKTTDQRGCITEGLKRARPIGVQEIKYNAANHFFVHQCLKNSRPTPSFCDGVPAYWNPGGPRWATEQCKKAGLDPTAISCEGVFEKQIDFCSGR